MMFMHPISNELIIASGEEIDEEIAQRIEELVLKK